MIFRLIGLFLLPLVVLVAEGIARLIAPPPFDAAAVMKTGPKAKHYGWAWPPGYEIPGRDPDTGRPYLTVTNSEGWKDVEHDREGGLDRTRILVLGDSLSFGAVPLPQLWTRRLEAVLHERGFTDVEVITMAVGGWGTDQQLEALTLEGVWYRPDLVVSQFSANDLVNNASPDGFIPEGRLEWSKPFRYEPKATVLARIPLKSKDVRTTGERFEDLVAHSGIGTVLRMVHPKLAATIPQHDVPLPGETTVLDPADPWFPYRKGEDNRYLKEGWGLLEQILVEMRSRASAAGASFLVFSEESDEGRRNWYARSGRIRAVAGGGHKVSSDGIEEAIDWSKPVLHLRAISERNDMGLVEPKRAWTRFQNDPAPNAEGNEHMALDLADAIEPWLRERAAAASGEAAAEAGSAATDAKPAEKTGAKADAEDAGKDTGRKGGASKGKD